MLSEVNSPLIRYALLTQLVCDLLTSVDMSVFWDGNWISLVKTLKQAQLYFINVCTQSQYAHDMIPLSLISLVFFYKFINEFILDS